MVHFVKFFMLKINMIVFLCKKFSIIFLSVIEKAVFLQPQNRDTFCDIVQPP